MKHDIESALKAIDYEYDLGWGPYTCFCSYCAGYEEYYDHFPSSEVREYLDWLYANQDEIVNRLEAMFIERYGDKIDK